MSEGTREILSDEGLAEIRERADKATEGPWVAEFDGDWQVEELNIPDEAENAPQICYQAQAYHKDTPANMKFIAHARQDIPDLLRCIEAQRRQLAAYSGVMMGTLDNLDVLERDCANNCFNFPDGRVHDVGDPIRAVLGLLPMEDTQP